MDSTFRRYYKPLLFVAVVIALAPLAESPLEWWRVAEISTSLVIVALLVEFNYYYRKRIEAKQPTVSSNIWTIDLLVVSYALLLGAATVQVFDFLQNDEPFRPLILLVTIPQVTSLAWLIPIVGEMERDHRARQKADQNGAP